VAIEAELYDEIRDELRGPPGPQRARDEASSPDRGDAPQGGRRPRGGFRQAAEDRAAEDQRGSRQGVRSAKRATSRPSRSTRRPTPPKPSCRRRSATSCSASGRWLGALAAGGARRARRSREVFGGAIRSASAHRQQAGGDEQRRSDALSHHRHQRHEGTSPRVEQALDQFIQFKDKYRKALDQAGPQQPTGQAAASGRSGGDASSSSSTRLMPASTSRSSARSASPTRPPRRAKIAYKRAGTQLKYMAKAPGQRPLPA